MMKPFDLEAAMRGEPICGSEGEPFRFICFDKVSNKVIYGYDSKRIASPDLVIANTCIFMAPKRHTFWVNLYKDWSSQCFKTKEEADANAFTRRTPLMFGKAYKLEIEE